jgi:RNA polymerase sigma-70 factor (ECF subfamily)
VQTDVPDALYGAVAEVLERLRTEASFTVPDATFVPYLAARLTPEDLAEARLEGIHLDDLYLVCGCVLGDTAAVSRFETEYGPAIAGHIRRILPEASDDLTQRTLTKLLVQQGSNAPRLASYAGRSALSAWIKVVATREALMERRKVPDPAASPDAALVNLVDDEDDPELALVRARHGEDFRRAFEGAFAELDPGERTLLRFQLIDRLTLDQIANVRGVHRATAARHLARVRQKLLTGTRGRLQQKLKLTETQLDSVLRVVQGQVEVSVRRLLGQ